MNLTLDAYQFLLAKIIDEGLTQFDASAMRWLANPYDPSGLISAFSCDHEDFTNFSNTLTTFLQNNLPYQITNQDLIKHANKRIFLNTKVLDQMIRDSQIGNSNAYLTPAQEALIMIKKEIETHKKLTNTRLGFIKNQKKEKQLDARKHSFSTFAVKYSHYSHINDSKMRKRRGRG